VAAQEQAVEKGCLSLRVLEIPQRLFSDHGRASHTRNSQFTESWRGVKGHEVPGPRERPVLAPRLLPPPSGLKPQTP
jgi:hypothetical protein